MRTMDTRENTQAQRSQQRRAALTRRERAMLSSAASASITPERFPKMSKAALAFARQMQANPHVRAVMRDLADK